MKFIFKEYINNITEDDIKKFAEQEKVTLTDEETKIIYLYLKNYWEDLLDGETDVIFKELKEKLRPDTYLKVLEVYDKYKKMLK